MNYAEASLYFLYDPETGVLSRTKANKKAGKVGPVVSVGGDGYVIVNHNGKKYKGHRVAWLLQTQSWPAGLVDHVNNNRTDNRWVNLRDVDACQNAQNAKRRVDNTSGATGVYFISRLNLWWARICVRNRHVSLGYFNSFSAAVSARADAKALHHIDQPL